MGLKKLCIFNFLMVLLLVFSTGAVCLADDEQENMSYFNNNLYQTKMRVDQKIFNLGGKLCGITYDNYNLYVARNGNEILKINIFGRTSIVCKLDDSNSSNDTYIRSLKFGKDGVIYAAASDRLLKITLDGKVTTIIYDPNIKPMGVELDQKGCIYIASEMKVFKYNPSLEKSLLIDCGEATTSFGLTDLKFDSKFKNLYVANYRDKQVYGYPINTDGSVGKQQLLFDSKVFTAKLIPSDSSLVANAYPGWLSVDGFGNLYISMENTGSILEIEASGSYILYKLDHKFSNSTIANRPYGGELYIVGSDDGKVHKMDLSDPYENNGD